MRTLEQCREEVFLRSRRRLRRRNQIRWAVGTACIPLILAAVLLLPGSPKGKESPRTEAVPDGAPPVSVMGEHTVSVRLPGAADVIPADPMLSVQLKAYFPSEETVTEPPAGRPESAPVAGVGASGGKEENYSSPAPVVIHCRTEDRDLTYILTGNQLTCEQFGKTVTLSDDQRSRLEACWREP